jgi:hypothetical protein
MQNIFLNIKLKLYLKYKAIIKIHDRDSEIYYKLCLLITRIYKV